MHPGWLFMPLLWAGSVSGAAYPRDAHSPPTTLTGTHHRSPCAGVVTTKMTFQSGQTTNFRDAYALLSTVCPPDRRYNGQRLQYRDQLSRQQRQRFLSGVLLRTLLKKAGQSARRLRLPSQALTAATAHQRMPYPPHPMARTLSQSRHHYDHQRYSIQTLLVRSLQYIAAMMMKQGVSALTNTLILGVLRSVAKLLTRQTI